jgi:hypothetical protein
VYRLIYDIYEKNMTQSADRVNLNLKQTKGEDHKTSDHRIERHTDQSHIDSQHLSKAHDARHAASDRTSEKAISEGGEKAHHRQDASRGLPAKEHSAKSAEGAKSHKPGSSSGILTGAALAASAGASSGAM